MIFDVGVQAGCTKFHSGHIIARPRTKAAQLTVWDGLKDTGTKRTVRDHRRLTEQAISGLATTDEVLFCMIRTSGVVLSLHGQIVFRSP